MSIGSDLWRSVRRRLAEASRLRGPLDVGVSFYDSLLRYVPRLPLPFRGRLYSMGLRGSDLSCWIRLGYSDGSIFDDVCVRGLYDAARRDHPPEVRQVVDLGANIGVTVRLWAHLFPHARIIAVEPDESNLQLCRQNASCFADRFTAIRAFAAGQSGSAYLNPGPQACTHTMTLKPQTASTAIPAYTLPEILEIGHADEVIDLLKCDIEGSEMQLFADCRPWIGRVRHLLIELHPPYTTRAFLDDLARGGSDLKLLWSYDTEAAHPTLYLG